MGSPKIKDWLIDREIRVIKLAGRSANKAPEICDSLKDIIVGILREQNGEGLPLSAFINKIRIHSFDYSKDEWNKLKQDRSSLDIKMTCCENRGILKTSRLGTHFFAHYRKGDCHAPAENKEHLLAKYIIAKTVHECGWKTFTEFQGETKNNEAWIADVYAENCLSPFGISTSDHFHHGIIFV